MSYQLRMKLRETMFIKKIASTLCVAVACVFAFQVVADDTYGIHYSNTGPYDPGYWENTDMGERPSGWQSGWTQVPGQNDTIGAWQMNPTAQAYMALKDSSLSLNIERNDTEGGFSYGTFLYDSSAGQIVANSEKYIGSVGAGELGSGVSVAYTAGDLAGIWVEAEGVRYYSQDSLNVGKHTESYQGDDSEGYANLWFDNGASWPDQDPSSVIKFFVGGVTLASSGAPLPGVLATMALCGAVGGYLRRKKNAAHIDRE
ncbi:MAG: hypothetical protein EOM03_14705 [Clostridia bacterium]|nr:hypothetical protein [Clostridia bacterium]